MPNFVTVVAALVGGGGDEDRVGGGGAAAAVVGGRGAPCVVGGAGALFDGPGGRLLGAAALVGGAGAPDGRESDGPPVTVVRGPLAVVVSWSPPVSVAAATPPA